MATAEETLRVLRDQFLQGSRPRLDRIAAALERLREEAGDRETLAGLRVEFHGFSGLGGTYGFPRVSALGHTGEERCDAILESAGATSPSEEDLRFWRGLLEEVREELGLREDPAAPRVLVVSDDPETWGALQAVLEMAGYSVDLVRTGDDLDDACSRFLPDLVILDDESASDPPSTNARAGAPPGMPMLHLAKASRAEGDGELPELLRGDALRKPVEPGALLAAVATRIESARSEKETSRV